MSFILEGLYLGDLDDACGTEKLKQYGVTHILTVDMKPLPIENRKTFKYKYVHALDMDDFDLLHHFAECIEFIQEGRNAGGILVHCYVGQSRSATVTAAYLMQKMDISIEDSILFIRCQRPQIMPNAGFIEQLELYENMGNTVDTNSQCYKKYKMQNLATQLKHAQTEGILQSLSEDPSQGLKPDDIYYKCRKCRRPLFKKTSVLSHVKGDGDSAFMPWHKKASTLDSKTDVVQTCVGQSLFIEPVKWMGENILQNEGKLSCPKCSAKLGSFKWIGEKCPCGTWVTPAFHIQSNKVDQTKQLNKPLSTIVAPNKSLALQGSSLLRYGSPNWNNDSDVNDNLSKDSKTEVKDCLSKDKSISVRGEEISAQDSSQSRQNIDRLNEITQEKHSNKTVSENINQQVQLELVRDMSNAVSSCSLDVKEELPPL